AKPGRYPRPDPDPIRAYEWDLWPSERSRWRPGSHRQSRTRVAPPTLARNDRPCRLVVALPDRRRDRPALPSCSLQPSAAERRHPSYHLADQIEPPPVCEKFLGTTNTVLCYLQTRRSLQLCFEQRLVNVFVAQKASFVFRITNY